MPSKLALTFGEGSMLDIAASFQAVWGDEGLGVTLRNRCDEGRRDV